MEGGAAWRVDAWQASHMDDGGWEELLVDAVRDGDACTVQLALDAGARLWTGEEELFDCVKHGHVEVMRVLLAHGADPTCTMSHVSIVFEAIRAARADMVRAAVEAREGREACMTPLQRAALVCDGGATFGRALEAWLAAGEGTDGLYRGGHHTDGFSSPLHLAAAVGDTAVLSAILGAVDVAREEYGVIDLTEAVSFAARGGHVGAVEMLVAAGGSLCSNMGVGEPISLVREAAYGGHVECVRAMLSLGAAPADLHHAGSAEVVAALVAAGAAVNGVDRRGDTPLDVAASDENVEVMRALLAAGARADATPRSSANSTLLSTPCLCGAADVVAAVLATGLQLPAAAGLGDALSLGGVEVVRALREAGGAPLVPDDWSAALQWAGSAAMVEEALRGGADVRWTHDRFGGTALHTMVQYGRVSAAVALVAAGADVNAPSKRGSTPLHAAACRQHAAAVEWLLRMGADPTRTDSDGRVPAAVVEAMGRYGDRAAVPAPPGNAPGVGMCEGVWRHSPSRERDGARAWWALVRGGAWWRRRWAVVGAAALPAAAGV
jgi:uncharacterized protein